MLAPDDRRVLLAALRPPDGYVVDRAIATTYTLDLVALLTAPLAFSMFDRLADREERPATAKSEPIDTFGLLHAVREHAERLTVFCQTACIHKPPKYRQLFPYLEGSVVQVGARSDEGVFHPKVWIQRFTREGAPVMYRLLVLSRNLTFDRSWDTVLTLEGELRDRTRAFAVNHPLGDFVASLPGLAVRPVAERIARDVEQIADEIRRVDFELPEGVEAVRFWPLGHDGRSRWPFDERIDRLLVVSPFVTPKTLTRLSERGSDNQLVSRLDELEVLSLQTLDGFAGVHLLHEAADPEIDDDEASALPAEAPPSGLHAKLYVADSGRSAHVWTGSANATDAAFERNVEMLVQLTGPKGRLGVSAVLDGEKGAGGGLRALLVPFTPPVRPVERSEAELRLDRQLRAMRLALGRVPWVAMVEAEHAASSETYTVTLHARGDGVVFPTGVHAAVRCWPIALPESRALDVPACGPGQVARFAACSFRALTTFFAFHVVLTDGDAQKDETFVLHVPLEGAPADRAARVLQGLLDEPAKVMRFLRMLLAATAEEALAAFDDDPKEGEGAARGAAWGSTGDVPLLESLVRALDRDPGRLLAVERLIRELRATSEGAALLPPELERVWGPIWEAHQQAAATRGEARGRR